MKKILLALALVLGSQYVIAEDAPTTLDHKHDHKSHEPKGIIAIPIGAFQ